MKFIDPYTADETELRLLQSEPVSFLVLGKSKSGKSELAAHIAKEWGVKLISEITLIENEINSGSDFGVEIKSSLDNGGVVTKSQIAKLYLNALTSEAADHYGVVVDGIPDVENKELLKIVKAKSRVLVNIKLNADDSTRSRSTMRYDPVSGQGFNLDCALPESDGGEEEGGTSESVGVDFKDILNNDKFVQRSEDLVEGISSDLDNFAAKVLPIHEELLTSCLESYRGTVVEVFNFSGITLSQAKENMMRQISVLDIPRALIPIELKNLEELPEEISTDELLRSVRNFNKPSQLFRWRRSRWGRYCPVALADGELVLGSPNFALAFLGKMFFISSQERYENFKINPRKYLIPTKPNNPLRIAVTGFPESGKSTIATELAKLFNCEIIRPDELVVEEKQKANKEALAKKRAEVTELAMGMVQSTLGTDEKVEETDPRVQEIINNQMEEAVQAEGPPLPPAVYVSKIKQHVADLCESRKNASESLCNGRWIIDGFPNTKADWNAMSEEGFMPNDLIVIRSQSDGYEDLMEAHFERNQDRFIEAYQTRRKAEKEEGDDNPIESRPPLTATEFDPFRSQIRNCDSALAQLTTNIYSSETSVLQLTYSHDNLGEMIKKVDFHIESRFEIQPWPWTGIDQQDEEDDSEFLGESEDDPFLANRDWGNTKNFDPVLLKDTNVLVPGDLEFQIKYKDDIFCCMDDENREKFLDAPEKYVSAEMPSTPPPIRICCVGQLGSGKSTQMAKLAKEQGIFHIDWKSFLEEKLLEKYEKRIGPSHIESNRLLAEQKLHEKEAMKTMLDAIVYPPEPNNSEENSKEEENDPEEESIKEYLESGEPIPYDTLDKLLRQFWREDPYKSKGFILEGFPSSADDLRYISGSANFPDSLLVLKCEKEVTVKRLLPERLATWQAWFDLKEKRRQAIREHKEGVRDRWIDSETAIAMAEEEIEEGTDVETLEQEMRERVASKFDESFLEVEDEFPESVEEAKERLSGEMMNETALERERLNNMFDLVEQAQIPKFEITCNRKPEEAYAKIKVALEKFLPPFRAAMFERVRGISLAQAENLLKANYFQLSSFGHWDPVELTAGNAFKPLDHNEGGVSFPVIYKSYIYFLNSLENRTKFVRNPLAYVQQQISSTIPSPHYNQRIAVVGPPKSGKTTLAKRMSAELGLLKVSVEDVVETLTSKFSKTVIAEQVHTILSDGGTLPDELLMIGLEKILLEPRSQIRGVVLDGFPQNKEQFEALQRRSILPLRVIELNIRDQECHRRNEHEIAVKEAYHAAVEASLIPPEKEAKDDDDEEEFDEDDYDDEEEEHVPKVIPKPEELYAITHSKEVMTAFIKSYKESIPAVKEAYHELYRNWETLNGKVNRWKLWCVAQKFLNGSNSQLQKYMKCIKSGNLAPLDGICITPNEFNKRLGKFKNYCPVSLTLRKELVDCTKQAEKKERNQFAVEWKGKYFRVQGQKELDLLFANPARFLETPLALPAALPAQLPAKTGKEILASGKTSFTDFCPVTYSEHSCAYEGLQRPDGNFAASYKEKTYVLLTAKALDRFMRRPEDFCNLQLPAKVPPKPLPLQELPTGGYLELGTGEALTDAIDAVGSFKPKLPFISVTDSSLIFVALYLKANNKKNPIYVRQKWKAALDLFKTDCENISFLGRKMTRRYKPKEHRLPELDKRLERFFDLEKCPSYLTSMKMPPIPAKKLCKK